MACTIKFKDGTEMSEAEFYAWAMDNIDLKEFAKTGNAIFINKKEQAAQFSAIKKLAYNLQKGFQALFGSKVEIITDTEEIDRILAGDQKGIKKQVDAWHGTPHNVDKFKTEKIGTGEGAQFFGWGLYFTDLEDIADKYRSSLSRKENYELWLADTTVENKISQYYDILDKTSNSARYDEIQDKINFLETLNETWDYNKAVTAVNKPNIIAWANKYVKPYVSDSLGKKYKVSLHKGKTPDQYTWLEWDKPVSRSTVKKFIESLNKDSDFKKNYGNSYLKELENGEYDNLTGENFYNGLAKSALQKLGKYLDKDVSLALLESGIDGVKYPAETISRGATSDTARGFNYVVFDENAITIEEEIQFMRDPKGKVLGFVYEGKIYIDPRTASPTTPIHEFGHIWNQYMKENHKAFYNRGIKLIKEEGGAYIEKVKKLYPELVEKGREADLYEEALAQAIGDRGRYIAKKDQNKFLNWLKDMWKFVKDGLKLSVSAEALSNMTLNDYTNLVAGSMLKGAEIATLLKAERTSQASTNPKFIKEVVKNLYAKKEKITTTIKNLMSELYKAESKGYANAMKSMKEREAAVIKLKEAAFKFLEDRGIKASDAMKLAISKITDAKSFARTLVKLSDMDESGIRAKKIGDIKKLVKQIKSLKKRNNKLTSADIYYIDNIAFPSPYEVSDLDGYEKVLTELKDSLDKGIRNVGVITKEKFNAFIQQESDYINAYKEMMFDIKQMIKDLETEAEYNELEANGLLAGTNIKSLEAWEKLKESINDIEESDAAQAKLDAIQERIEAKSEALDGLKERTKELMKLNKEEIVEAFKEFDGTPTPLSYEEIFNNIDNLSYNQLVKLGNIIDNILSDNDFSGIGAIASLGRLNAKSDNLFKELGNRVLRSFKDLKTENLSIQQLISEIAYAGDSINKALDFILGDWNSMISRVKKSYEQTFSNYEDLKRALANKKDKNKPLAIFNSTVRIDTYAFVNQWFKSDTEAEQNSHIVDRAKALADQHIRTLKAYGKVPNPSLSAKIEIDKAKKGLEALQDFGLIEDLDINNLSYSLNTKATKDSLLGKLNDKELKLYNFVIDSFKNLVNFKNALKINLDTQYEDIENYFPTFPKKIQEDADEASTEELKSVFNRMSKSNSRAKGRSRNLSSGKYNYNTGLTENFSKGYWEALILDMGSSELLDMSNMLYSKAGLQKLSEAGLNAEDTIPILRQRLNEKAVSDVNQGNINTNVSNAISIEMERTIKNGVVGMILKSPKQVLKQGNALLTSLIFKPQAASLAISMLHNPDKYYLAIQNILDKSTIQSRLILYDLNPVDLGVPSEYMYGKGRRTFAGLKKTQSAQETIGDVALPILKKMGAYKGNYSSFLASTDAHISKVNILTGYIDHQMKNGKTFEQIIKDLNDNKINSVSLQSAERWQSDLNAESIRSNIAPMLRKNVSGGKYFMKTFPFTTHQSFVQGLRKINEIKSDLTEEEKKDAYQMISKFVVQQMIYRATVDIGITTIAMFIEKGLFGGEGDDDEYFWNELLSKSAGQFLFDLAFGSKSIYADIGYAISLNLGWKAYAYSELEKRKSEDVSFKSKALEGNLLIEPQMGGAANVVARDLTQLTSKAIKSIAKDEPWTDILKNAFIDVVSPILGIVSGSATVKAAANYFNSYEDKSYRINNLINAKLATEIPDFSFSVSDDDRKSIIEILRIRDYNEAKSSLFISEGIDGKNKLFLIPKESYKKLQQDALIGLFGTASTSVETIAKSKKAATLSDEKIKNFAEKYKLSNKDYKFIKVSYGNRVLDADAIKSLVSQMVSKIAKEDVLKKIDRKYSIYTYKLEK